MLLASPLLGRRSLTQCRIKANSETPLLRLPPEVRNCIWEYALGDKVLDVVFVEKLKGPYIEEKTLIAADTFPDHSHALLQVCRQVYTETALIPFATNAFKFAREEAFDWARHLLPVQQKSIREVHIVTHRAERMLDWMHCDGHEKYMPDAFPLEVFPNVKNIVIKVGYSFIHNFTAGDDLTMEKQDELIREYIGKITTYVKEARPDAKLTFEHVNIKVRCSCSQKTVRLC